MKTLIRFLTTWVQRKKRRTQWDASDHTYQACRCHCYRTMAQNICTVLRMAAEPVTRDSITAFVTSLPLSDHDIDCAKWRAKYCNRCLYKAFQNTPETERYGLFFDLLCYFVNDFVKSSDSYKHDLMSALLGLMGGLSLDSTPGLYERLTEFQEHASKN